MKKLKYSNSDKNQKLKFWQNSTNLIVTTLKNSNCESSNSDRSDSSSSDSSNSDIFK